MLRLDEVEDRRLYLRLIAPMKPSACRQSQRRKRVQRPGAGSDRLGAGASPTTAAFESSSSSAERRSEEIILDGGVASSCSGGIGSGDMLRRYRSAGTVTFRCFQPATSSVNCLSGTLSVSVSSVEVAALLVLGFIFLLLLTEDEEAELLCCCWPVLPPNIPRNQVHRDESVSASALGDCVVELVEEAGGGIPTAGADAPADDDEEELICPWPVVVVSSASVVVVDDDEEGPEASEACTVAAGAVVGDDSAGLSSSGCFRCSTILNTEEEMDTTVMVK